MSCPRRNRLTTSGRRSVAISPTGTHLVYAANGQLYLRAMAESEAIPIRGTEDSIATIPFFSPDGQWIGFYSRVDGSLKKVAWKLGQKAVRRPILRFPAGWE